MPRKKDEETIRVDIPLLEDDEVDPSEFDDDEPALDIAEEGSDGLTQDFSHVMPEAIGASRTEVINGVTIPMPASEEVGVPTAPPMWKDAHLHPNVQQCRVFKVVDGNDVFIGDASAQMNINEFMRKFLHLMPRNGDEPARFKLQPLSANTGRPTGMEVQLPLISGQHTYLKMLRDGGGDEAVGTPSGRMPSPVPVSPIDDLSKAMAVMERLNAPIEARLKAAEEEARAAREAVALERARLSDMEIELAGKAAMGVEAISERMMKAEASRQEQALNALQQMYLYQQQMTAQAATEREREYRTRMQEEADRRERDRKAAEEERRREREEYERKRDREAAEFAQKLLQERLDREERIKREEMRLQREREDDQRRYDEREKERQHRYDREREDLQRRMEQERAFQAQMLALTQQRTHSESAEGLIEKGVGLLTKLGIQPQEAMERFLGGGGIDAYAPAIDGLVQVVTTGINNLGEYAKTKAVTEAAKNGQSAGSIVNAAMQQIPGPVQGAAPSQPNVVSQGVVNSPAPPQTGLVSRLDMPVQKQARIAIRALVQKIRSSPQEQWPGIVQQSISGVVAAYHYAKEQTLKAVLKEAEADDALFLQIAQVLAAPENKDKAPILQDIPLGA